MSGPEQVSESNVNLSGAEMSAPKQSGPEPAFPSREIKYGDITFVVPVLSTAGIRIRPGEIELPDGITTHPSVQDIGTVWDYDKILEGRTPAKLGYAIDRAPLDMLTVPSVLDMPMKFPGTGYSIPDTLGPMEATLEQMISYAHALYPNLRDTYAYATIHQSDVEGGKFQRRPGLHVDGFQGIEQPEKTEIEFSIILASAVPTTFSTQRFALREFDHTVYNLFSEMDRIAIPELEFQGEPYGIYLMDPYTAHRASVAAEDVFRTFIRITWSVRVFDRLGLTDNPTFPYDWDRQPHNLQASFKKYSPPLQPADYQQMESLAEISGDRIGVIGIGGGSDGLSAKQVQSLLEKAGKKVEFLASYRAERPIMGTWQLSDQVHQLSGESIMQGRFFEGKFADSGTNYVVMDDGESDLSDSFDLLVKRHDVDSLVFVDGGGNVINPAFVQDRMLGDHRTILAAKEVDVPHKTVMVVAPGIDVPADANETFKELDTARYVLSESDRELVLENFKQGGMGYPNPHTFAFIPMIWQQALLRQYGDQGFPTIHPADPKFKVVPANADLLVMDYDGLVEKISEP